MARSYLGTITLQDWLVDATICPARGVLGRILESDIGKRYYRVGNVTQVENDEQRNRRLGLS